MTATLDELDAQLDKMEAAVQAPGFRVRTPEEHRRLDLHEIKNAMISARGGEPLPAPIEGPPPPESDRAVAELLADIHRLKREVAAQKTERLQYIKNSVMARRPRR